MTPEERLELWRRLNQYMIDLYAEPIKNLIDGHEPFFGIKYLKPQEEFEREDKEFPGLP